MRLDKFLCDTMNITRKDSKDFIKKNTVLVNDKLIKDPGFSVKENSDMVLVNGSIISYEKFSYYMLNKPVGYVSATTDKNDLTVIDLFKKENVKNLFPVGRLDKDTVGLLLITNDGNLSHHLTSPNHHVPKCYYVKLLNPISTGAVEALENGILLTNDGLTKPAHVKIIDDLTIELTITEGMYHQVKRMLKAVDNEVVYLKRLSMGSVKLDESLKEGEYRRLTEEEILLLSK